MKSATILVGILLVIGVSCHHENFPEEIVQSINVCLEELNISEDERKEALEKHDHSNPKFRCMHECVMRVSGMIVDKEANVDKIKKVMKHVIGDAYSEEKCELLIEKCLGEAQAKEDKCEFSMAYEECIMDSYGTK